MRRIASLFVFSSLLLALASRPTRAECDCAASTNKDLFKCSSAVFTGKVTGGGVASRVEVHRVFKGRVARDVVFDWAGECGIILADGEEYLFYAYDRRDGGRLWRTSICAHTRRVSDKRASAALAELERKAWWWRLPLSGFCR